MVDETAVPEIHLLTTIDNPYNPFTHYNEWYQWDASAGYHTPELLARTVQSSNDLSEAQERTAIWEGMRQIVEINVTGMHKMVTEQSFSQS